MSYIPTDSDIAWTQNAIQGKKLWAVPSGGFIIKFDHSNMDFRVLMKSNPERKEVELYSRIRKNLTAIGYTSSEGQFIQGVDSTHDILKAIGFSEEDIEISRQKAISSRRQNFDQDWKPNIKTIEWTKNHISGLGEGALWVIPDGSAIMKISHKNKNYTFMVGKNQTDDETIYVLKTIEVMKKLDYNLAGLFIDEADISLEERLNNCKSWFLD